MTRIDFYDYAQRLRDEINDIWEQERALSLRAGQSLKSHERLELDTKVHELCLRRAGISRALDIFVDMSKG